MSSTPRPFSFRMLTAVIALFAAAQLTHAQQVCSYAQSAASATVLCPPPAFEPAPALSFSTAGAFTRQYLGAFWLAPGGVASPTAQQDLSPEEGLAAEVLAPGFDAAVRFSNVQLSTAGPDGTVDTVSHRRFVYADVNVTTPAAVLQGVLLVQLFAGAVQAGTGVDVLTTSGSVAPACGKNVTSAFAITAGKPMNLFGTPFWTQIVSLRNLSGSTISGPVELGLTGLTANAQLLGSIASGTCPAVAGAPYQLAATDVAPGATVQVVLTFTNSQIPSAAISYTPVLISGGGRL